MRPIWIDALCIDQTNPGEKMGQIREMNLVYQHANKVWIWLGTAQQQERIPAAIRFLENLRDAKSSQPHRKIDDLYEKLGFATLPEKSALSHLVFNDWFERLWVLQEAALAKEPTFLCGDNECSWELMEDAMRDEVLYRLFEKEFYEAENPAHLCDDSVRTGTRRAAWSTTVFQVRSWARHGWGREFIGPKVNNKKGAQVMMLAFAIIMSRSQVCLRPEDHVLGLLGLMKPKYFWRTCLDPEVPYVSVEDLFTRVTKFILEIAWDREIGTFWTWISWACALDRRQGLPSWAPNLSSSGPSTNMPRRYHSTSPSRYTTIGKLQRWYPTFIKQDQLKLAGKVLDEVVKVFAQMPFSSSTRDAPRPEQRGHLLAISHWESTIADVAIGRTLTRSKAEGDDDGSLEEYWRTLVDNLKLYQDETITSLLLASIPIDKLTLLSAETEPQYPRFYSPVKDSEELLKAEAQYPNAYKFLEAMQEARHRRLFKTKKGHLSSTMPGVMPDDVLIAPNGAPILYVIRKVKDAVDDEPELWEFVGDAYVYSPDCENDKGYTLERKSSGASQKEAASISTYQPTYVHIQKRREDLKLEGEAWEKEAREKEAAYLGERFVFV
ncbi:hypothetical protein J4E91_002312 [Alternaria rosae]|nr:hypothetical protein J4E91_002312 [Alternaria rosae]